MSKLLGCSVAVIYRQFYKEGIKLRDKYTRISEDELHAKIADLSRRFPNSGSEVDSIFFLFGKCK